MTARAVAAFATLLLLAVALAEPSASAGYVTGVGTARVAHLFDAANAAEATVTVPETFSGFSGFTYHFVIHGGNSTAARAYRVAVVVSPGSDTEARWNASGSGPAGAGEASINVTIGPNELPFNVARTPFEVELQAADGALLDTAAFSVDLKYREPPPDGGLLQLAIASAFFWGLVFLYGLNLHLAQRKLRARADALERSIEGSTKEVRAGGEKR